MFKRVTNACRHFVTAMFVETWEFWVCSVKIAVERRSRAQLLLLATVFTGIGIAFVIWVITGHGLTFYLFAGVYIGVPLLNVLSIMWES